jgi:hypothetical protein
MFEAYTRACVDFYHASREWIKVNGTKELPPEAKAFLNVSNAIHDAYPAVAARAKQQLGENKADA